MSNRIRLGRVISLNDGAETDAFIYEETETDYEALVKSNGTVTICYFPKSTLHDSTNNLLLHIYDGKSRDS